MDGLPLVILVVLTITLLCAVLILLNLQFKRPANGGELSIPLQNLTQAVQAGHSQTAVLVEKVSHLEPLAQTVNALQVELKGLSERVSTVEQSQSAVGLGINVLANNLSQTSTTTSNLLEATTAMRAELSRARDGLTELQSHSRARQEVELRTAESIRRLEAIIAGTTSKGSAGENILEAVFTKLPPEWQVHNFRVGNKSVEFGLRLPNNLILPIDSKWAATNLIEQFAACEDPNEQQRLKAQIESTVIGKAREVKKYIDPALTINFGIAAVPDAVYDLCGSIQAEVFLQNVVLVSYSMFVPYLLLVFQTVLKTSQNIDIEKLDAYLRTAQDSVKAIQDEIEGRFSRSITMLNNSRDHMSLHISKVNSGLTSLQMSASASETLLPISGPEKGLSSYPILVELGSDAAPELTSVQQFRP